MIHCHPAERCFIERVRRLSQDWVAAIFRQRTEKIVNRAIAEIVIAPLQERDRLKMVFLNAGHHVLFKRHAIARLTECPVGTEAPCPPCNLPGFGGVQFTAASPVKL